MAARTGTALDALEAVYSPTTMATPPGKVGGSDKNGTNGQQRDVTVELQYLRNDPLYETVKPLQITPNFLDHEHKTNVKLESGPTRDYA